MKTGWSKRFHNETLYRNKDEQGVMHFPGFSKEVSQFLVKERKIHGIGVDTLSLDNGKSTTYDTHVTMLKNNYYQIENMVLENVPEHGGVIFALPLKITGGPEAQTRAFVLVPK
jgi:kynurenine formamidase